MIFKAHYATDEPFSCLSCAVLRESSLSEAILEVSWAILLDSSHPIRVSALDFNIDLNLRYSRQL